MTMAATMQVMLYLHVTPNRSALLHLTGVTQVALLSKQRMDVKKQAYVQTSVKWAAKLF